MKILVDATSLLLRSAGVKSYTWHWLRALQRVAEPGSVTAFPWMGLTPGLTHDRSVLNRWATWARLGAVFGINRCCSWALDAACRGCDVFHGSNMVRVPPRRARLTATLHDLTCWLMPELHTAANIAADRYFAERILKRADRLIAVSENTRQDAVRLLGIDPDRIVTIHSGVDERFFTAAPIRRAKPYVLFLGTIEPRKNVDTLLDAWEQLPGDVRGEYDLVVAGPAGWKSGATMARLRSGGARYLGYVPESEIPSLTAGATVFVYMSLYEGFGFPVAQAMAAGVPVVTSSNSCLPEIAGDGALYADPRSPAEIGTALGRLLCDPARRVKLSAAGRARAGRYRWEDCARQSLELFQRL